MNFEAFAYAEPATRPKPSTTPDVEPDDDPMPEPPPNPVKPIERPSVDPRPIAKKKASEKDVAKRFMEILKNRRESIRKYI
jgi:protein TonB